MYMVKKEAIEHKMPIAKRISGWQGWDWSI